MKFTDKFVLVPIERYNQLTRGKGIEEEGVEKERESLLSKKDVNIKPKIGEEKDIDKTLIDREEKTEVHTDIGDKIDGGTNKNKDNQVSQPKTKNTPENKKKTLGVEKKKSRRQLIPAPPPGIPNRLKKSKFRWISIY